MLPNPLEVKLSHFTRLSRADCEMIRAVTSRRLRDCRAHADIIREGDRPEHINLVLSGWACRYKVLRDGRRQIVGIFLPGDLCDLNVFVLRHMDHSISAITDVTLAEISRESFDDLMLGHPRITQALWWESLVTMATQREWAVNLGQRNATERVAHLFCELFIRLQTVGLTQGDTMAMPLTQPELGDATGLSSVHVNRTLQELRASGLILLHERVLTLPDLQGLKQVALFNDNYLHLDRVGRKLDSHDHPAC
jgi:CRP-like cAMP-binding protein